MLTAEMASKTETVKASPEKGKEKSLETSKSDKKSVKTLTKSKKPTMSRKTLLRLKPGTIRYGRAKRAIIKRVLKPHIKKKEKEVTKAPVKLVKTSKKSKQEKVVKGKGKGSEKVVKGKGGEKKVVKGKGGEKKVVKTRQLLVKKPPSYYPTEVRKGRTHDKKKTPRQQLKKSLAAGVVCIVLAGPQKGKRVVFLKQLDSGLCLVTGPFILNKCPLRRINQIYLIGTSTKIDLGDFKVPEHIDDKYFKKVKLNKKKTKKEEGEIFNEKPKKYIVSAVKKADQKIVDIDVLKCMKKRKDRKSLCAYMSSKFRLFNQQFPHQLKF